MSWYVLHCRPGREQEILNSCRYHLSERVIEEAFVFQSERLWKVEGGWKLVNKMMFPGYVFLQSSHPGMLSRELDKYRNILNVMEEKGYLISVYEDEEKCLRELCGENHILRLSYGYKDKSEGISYITEGPLIELQGQIIKLDWHRRFAQLELPVARKKNLIWAGVGIAYEAAKNCGDGLITSVKIAPKTAQAEKPGFILIP